MKRILIGAVLLAVLVSAGTALASAPKPKHHAVKTAVAAVDHAVPAACTVSDRSRCPLGSCGACSKGVAAAAASHPVLTKSQPKLSAAACPGVDPASCPASCRKTAEDASASRVASR